jgi:hypothetical protein
MAGGAEDVNYLLKTDFSDNAEHAGGPIMV